MNQVLKSVVLEIESVDSFQYSSKSPEIVKLAGVVKSDSPLVNGKMMEFTNYWSVWRWQDIKIDELTKGETMKIYYKTSGSYNNFLAVCKPDSAMDRRLRVIEHCCGDSDHGDIRNACGCGDIDDI